MYTRICFFYFVLFYKSVFIPVLFITKAWNLIFHIILVYLWMSVCVFMCMWLCVLCRHRFMWVRLEMDVRCIPVWTTLFSLRRGTSWDCKFSFQLGLLTRNLLSSAMFYPTMLGLEVLNPWSAFMWEPGLELWRGCLQRKWLYQWTIFLPACIKICLALCYYTLFIYLNFYLH